MIESHEDRKKYIQLVDDPTDLCVLPNGQLAVVFYSSLGIYDNDFNMVKIVDQVGEFGLTSVSFRPISIAADNIDRIYIVNQTPYAILMTDSNFKQIKFIDLNLILSNKQGFMYGICFSSNHVYLCKSTHRQILKFSAQQLELIQDFKIDYTPLLIKSVNDTICVKSANTYELFFYNIETFELKHRYKSDYGRISVINNLFYNAFFLQCAIFMPNGELVKKVNLTDSNNKDSIELNWIGFMVYFNHHILMLCTDKICALQIFKIN